MTEPDAVQPVVPDSGDGGWRHAAHGLAGSIARRRGVRDAERTAMAASPGLRAVVLWAPGVVAVTATAVLLGWALDAAWLTQLRPAWPAMTPSTAVGLLLAAAAVHPRLHEGGRAARTAASTAGWAVTTLAVVTLAGHVAGQPVGVVSDVLAARGVARLEGVLGPSPATAVSLTLVGVAAILWSVRPRPWRIQHALALTAASLAYVALLGYALRISSLYAPPGLPVGVGMAAHTAVGVLLLSSTLLARWLLDLQAGRPGHLGINMTALGVAGLLAGLAMVPLNGTAGATTLAIVLAALATLLSLVVVTSWERSVQARRQRDAVESMRSDFVTSVSHHIRTPLTVVSGMAATLAQRGEQLAPEQAAELAGRLDHHAQRLSVLLVDLLDLTLSGPSPSDEGRAPIRVDEVVATLLEEADLDRHPLDLASTPATAAVDPRAFTDAFARLLDNVSRHTPAHTRTRVEVEQVGEWARISVEDAGPGIPLEALERVFEPFEQGRVVPDHSPGMGIGLARVNLFAQMNGGRVWAAESELGGVGIHLELPANPPS